jgi:hypothetical protein
MLVGMHPFRLRGAEDRQPKLMNNGMPMSLDDIRLMSDAQLETAIHVSSHTYTGTDLLAEK